MRPSNSRVFCIAVVLCTCVGSSLLTRQLLSQAAVKTELTATMEETFYRYPSGERVRVQPSKFVQFSDGSTVEVLDQVSPGGIAVQRRTVTDLQRRQTVVVDGLTESVTTYKLNDTAVAFHRRHTDATCSAASSSPRERLLGFEVVRLEERTAMPDGEIRKVESWRAPSLNCLSLKETLYLGRQEAALSITSMRIVNEVQLQEPANSLLTTPAGYVERAPSAVLAEYRRRYAPNQDVCPTCGRAEAADGAYYSHQKN